MKQYPCEFIQDLLPAYIDNVVSTETMTLVSDHLANCEECRSICESMREEGISYIGEGKAGSGQDSPEAPQSSARVINYMEKLHRKRRNALRAVAISLIVIAVISVLSVRSYNRTMYGYGSYVATGEMLIWPEDEINRRFIRDGEEYVRLDTDKYLSDTDAQDTRLTYYDDEMAEFNIKEDKGFWGALFATDKRCTMRNVGSGCGTAVYQSDRSGDCFIKKEDEDKADKYFSDIRNYTFIFNRAKEASPDDNNLNDEEDFDTVDYDYIPLDFSSDEKTEFIGLEKKQTREVIKLAYSEIMMACEIDIHSGGNNYAGEDIVVSRMMQAVPYNGKWYRLIDWELADGQETEGDNMLNDCNVYEFPKSISRKLDAAMKAEPKEEI